MDPRPTRKQHLISKGILARFTDPTDKQLVERHLGSGKERPRYTSQVGYEIDFVSYDPNTLEAVWSNPVEQNLPEVFAAIDNGTILADDRLCGLLLDCLALHYIRTRNLRTKFLSIVDQVIDDTKHDLLATERPRIERVYRDQHAGLHPGSTTALLDFIDSQVRQSVVVGDLGTGKLLHERLTVMYSTARDLMHNWQVQIVTPAEGTQFVLGDEPGQLHRHATNGMPLLFDGAFGDAHTFVLPIGPGHLVAVGPEAGWDELSAEAVRRYNFLQVARAHHHVYMAKGADFDDLVQSAFPAQ